MELESEDELLENEILNTAFSAQSLQTNNALKLL
jgi:hypothetical protein